jgi:formiminoglutamase
MLESWTSVVSKKILERSYSDFSLKQNISIFQKPKFKLKKERIALIGCNDGLLDAVRPILYAFAGNFGKTNIADLGNLKNLDADHNPQLMQDLVDAGITPIVVSATASQLHSHLISSIKNKKKIHCSLIDETVPTKAQGPIDQRLLFPIATNKIQWPDQFKILGIQKHQVAAKQIQEAEKNNLRLFRLGGLKTDLTMAEPLLRDTNVLGFNGRVLKSSETQDKENHSPSGLSIDQACQLMRYAGINEQMQFVNIYGFDDRFAPNPTTAHAVAQLIWYFLDGFFDQKGDYPVDKRKLKSYVVDLKYDNLNISFWKSKKSGRWWVEVPRTKGKSVLMPCSQKEYESCAAGILSDNLVEMLESF